MGEKNENELGLELQRQYAHEAWRRLDIQPPFPESLQSTQLLQLLKDASNDVLKTSVGEKDTVPSRAWIPKNRLIYLAASFAVILGGLCVTGFGASFSKRLTSENTSAQSSSMAAAAQNETIVSGSVNDSSVRSTTVSLPESIPQASQEESTSFRYNYALAPETAGGGALPTTNGTPVPAAEPTANPHFSASAYSPTEAAEIDDSIDIDANMDVNINDPFFDLSHSEDYTHKLQPNNTTAAENIEETLETTLTSDYAADSLNLDTLRSACPLCANLPAFDASWELVYFMEQDLVLTLRLQQTSLSDASIDIHCSAADPQNLTTLLSSQQIQQFLQGELDFSDGEIPIIDHQDLSLAVISRQFSTNQNNVLRILYPNHTLLSFTFTNLTPEETFTILSSSKS